MPSCNINYDNEEKWNNFDLKTASSFYCQDWFWKQEKNVHKMRLFFSPKMAVYKKKQILQQQFYIT